MAKARAKSRKRTKGAGGAKIAWGGPATKGANRLNVILGAVAVAAVIAGGLYWWQGRQAQDRFTTFVEAGQAALARVETFPDDGRSHLQSGESHRYSSVFPTSGPHSPVWTKAGVYTTAQPPVLLVHALEHGNIVIYVDDPGPEAVATLEDWAGLYGGQWDGIVLTTASGLGRAVVLTAWRRALRLDAFDPAATAAFIDAYRGRGPENPVR